MLTSKLVHTVLVAIAMAALQTAPAHAAVLFFSAAGSGGACTQAQPCTLSTAIAQANGSTFSPELSCADSSDSGGGTITKSATIDCSGTAGSMVGVTVNGSGITVTLKNLTMWGGETVVVLVNGTLILDNVHLTGNRSYAINATPTAPSNLVVRNSIIDGNAPAGVLLKPQAGGSLSAKFDHVAVTHNAGAGIRVDTTGGGGAVTADIADSIISDNAANGLIAVSGSGVSSLINITNSTVANNTIAGISANGSNAAALVDKTLLDGNVGGATSFVAGGRILTYQNNRIVGSAGTGFTGTAAPQ